jgi:anti-sigma-K factor RskA
LKHERATEEIREMAALYALGSLTQHEARSFEIHIREGCSVCEEELHRYERTAAGIGFAVDEIDTPEYIRDLLLARVEREPQTTAAIVTSDGTNGSEPSSRAVTSDQTQPALFQGERKKSYLFAWAFVLFFAAIAILATYAWNSAQKANGRLLSEVSAARADADNLRTLLDSQKGKPVDLEQILAVAGLPGTRIARMVGQSIAPDASGAVLWDMQQNQCLFFGLLPPAPPGKAYQLWINTPTEKIAAGMIKATPTGRIFATTVPPRGIMSASALIITLEPESGSQTPTLPFYAVGRLD